MIHLKQYNIIVWDWNGTLFDDAEFCKDIMNKLLVKRNLPEIDMERYKSVFTFPLQDYYKAVGHDLTNGSFQVLGEEFMEYYEAGKLTNNLHTRVPELLARLNSLGKSQFMLSAYSHGTLEELIHHYGIAEYFSSINGNDNIFAEGKLGLAKSLISKIGNPSEILMIGDTLHDSEIAAEVGVDCVLLSSGHQSAEKLKESGNVVLNSTEELYTLTIQN